VKRIEGQGQLVFHAVGDTGSTRGPHSQSLVADKMASDFDDEAAVNVPQFFFHLGDVVYSFGEAQYYCDQFYELYRGYPARSFRRTVIPFIPWRPNTAGARTCERRSTKSAPKVKHGLMPYFRRTPRINSASRADMGRCKFLISSPATAATPSRITGALSVAASNRAGTVLLVASEAITGRWRVVLSQRESPLKGH
jgi:hypothetical protein